MALSGEGVAALHSVLATTRLVSRHRVGFRYFEGLSILQPAGHRCSNLRGSEVLAKSVQDSLRAHGSQTAAEIVPKRCRLTRPPRCRRTMPKRSRLDADSRGRFETRQFRLPAHSRLPNSSGTAAGQQARARKRAPLPQSPTTARFSPAPERPARFQTAPEPSAASLKPDDGSLLTSSGRPARIQTAPEPSELLVDAPRALELLPSPRAPGLHVEPDPHSQP